MWGSNSVGWYGGMKLQRWRVVLGKKGGKGVFDLGVDPGIIRGGGLGWQSWAWWIGRRVGLDNGCVGFVCFIY